MDIYEKIKRICGGLESKRTENTLINASKLYCAKLYENISKLV